MSIKLRRWLSGLTVLGALAGLVSGAAAQSTNDSRPPAPRRASIVLIVADNLGWGDLGCYGQNKIKTPNLDQLAAEGVRFTDYYAGGAADGLSRAALFLGLHSGHLNLRGDVVELPDDAPNVAAFLKQAGYRTGLIGKWSLGVSSPVDWPQHRGFDQFAGFREAGEAENDYAESIWRYDPDPVQGTFDGKMQLAQNEDGHHRLYIPDLITTSGTNFMRINVPDQFNSWRPFFLQLNYTIPHAGDWRVVPARTDHGGPVWSEAEEKKAAMIASLDAGIGRLIVAMKRLKLESNTIVIFTSANGPQKSDGVDPKFMGSTAGFRGARGELTEGGLRVPMIVWSPRLIKPAVVTQPWAAWDVFPTLAEIARQSAPTNIDGISFLTTLYHGSQTNLHDNLYWELPGDHVQQAVRAIDWKAYRPRTDAPLQLYDMKTDVEEAHNLADKNPGVVKQMDRYMQAVRVVPATSMGTPEKGEGKP